MEKAEAKNLNQHIEIHNVLQLNLITNCEWKCNV